MSKLLKKTAESAVKQDKNGRNYKTVTFTTLPTVVLNGQTIHVPTKSSSINVNEESYLNNQEEFGYSLSVNSLVQGDIVTRNVEPYQIADRSTGEMRTVTTYTSVVLGDTDDAGFEVMVQKTIARRQGVTADALTDN